MARRTVQSVRAADATASRWEWIRALLSLASVVPVLLEHGWLHRLLPLNLAEFLVFAALASYGAATVRQAVVRSRGGGSLWRELRRHRSMLILAGAGALILAERAGWSAVEAGDHWGELGLTLCAMIRSAQQ